MDTEIKKKYLAYARQPERDMNGVLKGISINDQIMECRKHVESIGGEVVKTFLEMKYPGGTILKYYDYSGKIDGIVVYRLSHLGNSLDDSIKVIEAFLKNGKELISVTEKVNLKIQTSESATS